MKKHPHTCGEDPASVSSTASCREPPPRVWGRHPQRYPAADDGRNTPTHVGKTDFDINQQLADQKHPHACGEDHARENYIFLIKETPPRMWGRLNIGVIEGGKLRNTPTHVGKTLTGTFTRTNTEKHPHACREDQQGFCQYALRQEIPPHMWGRPRHLQISGIQQRKHPHACGEDNIFERAKTASGETPPRMWGRLIDPASINQLHRNTPTHVGKTSGGRLSSLRTSETPPRMWGRP
ncbi:Domain of uncharacterised function (DUF2825) [Klebsiella pneumoniae]|nr:Domain of uncharacterised function (DUF2825) [Klebsiella pneumoniae]